MCAFDARNRESTRLLRLVYLSELPNVFEEHKEMQGVGWRREEIETLVKLSSCVRFGMDCQGTNSYNVGSL